MGLASPSCHLVVLVAGLVFGSQGERQGREDAGMEKDRGVSSGHDPRRVVVFETDW